MEPILGLKGGDSNSRGTKAEPIIGVQIPKGGQDQIKQFIREFKDVFMEEPGRPKGCNIEYSFPWGV